MIKNEYLLKVFEDVKTKNCNENEFIDAAYEFLESIEAYVEKNENIKNESLLERFLEPERVIMFRVPWIDDNGNCQVNRGYRVQFNSAIGPYKGGIRFHESVNLSIMKFLSLEQTLKNSITGLNIGGAKGGADFNPKGKSDNEIMRFCQSFVSELYRHIGPDTDIPAGDIGVSKREIGYMFGYYKKLTNSFVGTFTGKGLEFGGSIGRVEATGYGLVYFTEKMMNIMKNETFKNKKVIISGSGNVALYALKKVNDLGGIVVGMSDSNGYIYNENGINFDKLKEIKEIKRLRIKEYLSYDPTTIYKDGSKDLFKIKADIILPCATQNEIDLDSAKVMVSNGVICVSEGANRPCSIEASKYFIEHKIMYGPAKAANSGGVMVSGFEMSQNSMRQSWSLDEVLNKLKNKMEEIFININKISKEYGNEYNTILGANLLGFIKVKNAMEAQGII